MYNFPVIYFIAFMITNFIAFANYPKWDDEFLLFYAVMSFVFFFSFYIGYVFFENRRVGLNNCIIKSIPSKNKLIVCSILLFIFSQAYYAQYLYMISITKNIFDYEYFRLQLQGNVNNYFAPVGFSCLMISVAYLFWVFKEWVLVERKKSFSFMHMSIILLCVFSVIAIYEMSMSGSRSSVLLFLWVLIMFLYKYRIVGVKMIMLFAITMLPVLGFFGYLRVATSPNRLAWYITNRIIREQDSPLMIALAMVAQTFKGIGERTVMIINGIMDGTIPHQYGYDSFFYLFSILPGEQVKPTVWLNHYLFFGSNSNFGYPPTVIAQFLWDFGIIGVPIIGLVLGGIGGILYNNYKNNTSPVWIVAYALFLGQCFFSLYGEFRLGWLLVNITMIIMIDYFMRGKIRIKNSVL